MMLELNYDWEFNVLGIYNYKKRGPFSSLFDFVRHNHATISGDIVEAGVFQGKSLIAMGMLLKEIGSQKRVYGFDSFAGFPPVYDPKDHLDSFANLYKNGKISCQHFLDVKKNLCWREFLSGTDVSVSSISSSGDFSKTNIDLVLRKIDLVGLDNIILVDGPFSETMSEDCPSPQQIMAVLMDCDLYASYMQTFSFVWPRLSVGGMIYLDEYYSLKFPGARIATDEFLVGKKAHLKNAKSDPYDFERWYLIKD